MKKILFLLFAGLFVAFTGCNEDDDSYSLGDIWLGFGIVENAESFKIVMDNGDILLPVAFAGYYQGYENEKHQSHPIVKAGDRVLVNYTVLDDKLNADGKVEAYYVKVNSAEKILMKGILEITEENEDSIGNDPIIVMDHWVSNNLLNLKLKYWGQQKVHFINLVKEPGQLTAAKQPFLLELRHNDNDDNESIPYISFVSFQLDSLEVAGTDTITFKVSSTDYDGNTVTFTKGYRYDNN